MVDEFIDEITDLYHFDNEREKAFLLLVEHRYDIRVYRKGYGVYSQKAVRLLKKKRS